MSEEKSAGKGYGISLFVGGLILGIALTGFAVTFSLPRMMIEIHDCTNGFDETVAEVESRVADGGWKISKIYDIQKSLVEAGAQDIGRMKIFSVCNSEYAERILKEDGRKKVSALMPCRISVYETKDGKVHIARLNVGLMSKMFGGEIEKVMKLVSDDQREMLKPLLK